MIHRNKNLSELAPWGNLGGSETEETPKNNSGEYLNGKNKANLIIKENRKSFGHKY